MISPPTESAIADCFMFPSGNQRVARRFTAQGEYNRNSGSPSHTLGLFPGISLQAELRTGIEPMKTLEVVMRRETAIAVIVAAVIWGCKDPSEQAREKREADWANVVTLIDKADRAEAAGDHRSADACYAAAAGTDPALCDGDSARGAKLIYAKEMLEKVTAEIAVADQRAAEQQATERRGQAEEVRLANERAQAKATGGITGAVWVKREDGATLGLALQDVYCLPATFSPSGEVVQKLLPDVVESLRSLVKDMRSAYSKPTEDVSAKAENVNGLGQADDLEKAANLLEKDSSSPRMQTSELLRAVEMRISTVVYTHRALNSLLGGHPSTPDREFKADPGWDALVALAVAATVTDRDGRFSIEQVPAGKYVVICRAYLPANFTVIYWGNPAFVAPASICKIDLNNANGDIMSY